MDPGECSRSPLATTKGPLRRPDLTEALAESRRRRPQPRLAREALRGTTTNDSFRLVEFCHCGKVRLPVRKRGYRPGKIEKELVLKWFSSSQLTLLIENPFARLDRDVESQGPRPLDETRSKTGCGIMTQPGGDFLAYFPVKSCHARTGVPGGRSRVRGVGICSVNVGRYCSIFPAEDCRLGNW